VDIGSSGQKFRLERVLGAIWDRNSASGAVLRAVWDRNSASGAVLRAAWDRNSASGAVLRAVWDRNSASAAVLGVVRGKILFCDMSPRTERGRQGVPPSTVSITLKSCLVLGRWR